MPALYARWIDRWETRLANRDQNRVIRPFEWGLDWLGLPSQDSPVEALARYATDSIRGSDAFFRHSAISSYTLTGSTLSFPSPLQTRHPENDLVSAEYFPAKNHAGRAVLVIPQWNSDEASHLGLCRILQRFGVSALRLSPAYHHRRMPRELQRADYHVSANLGRTIHATRQSVLDARGCLDWLVDQGYTRVGMLGTSLGSCITLLTACHDPRVSTGVFNHVSMYFSDVVWTGMSCRHIRQTLEEELTADDLRRIWSIISPASYLDRPELSHMKSLLIWAPYDTTFRPEFSQRVVDAFSRRSLPYEVFRLPCGHYTTAKFPYNWIDGWVMIRFLLRHL